MSEELPPQAIARIQRSIDLLGVYVEEIPDEATGERIGTLFLEAVKDKQRSYSWWTSQGERTYLHINELRPEVHDVC